MVSSGCSAPTHRRTMFAGMPASLRPARCGLSPLTARTSFLPTSTEISAPPDDAATGFDVAAKLRHRDLLNKITFWVAQPTYFSAKRIPSRIGAAVAAVTNRNVVLFRANLDSKNADISYSGFGGALHRLRRNGLPEFERAPA